MALFGCASLPAPPPAYPTQAITAGQLSGGQQAWFDASAKVVGDYMPLAVKEISWGLLRVTRKVEVQVDMPEAIITALLPDGREAEIHAQAADDGKTLVTIRVGVSGAAEEERQYLAHLAWFVRQRPKLRRGMTFTLPEGGK
ncbi:MAG: hypothetical protein WD042_14690 [Phycisphaeraceae bacterium]